MKDFNTWMEEKYIEWRGKSRRSVSDFAAEMGVSQSLMSAWMRVNGKVPKTKKYIDILIARYGDEVYDILGIQKEGPSALLAYAFPKMSHDVRDRLAGALSEFEEAATGRPDDPAVTQALIEALKNNGFQIG